MGVRATLAAGLVLTDDPWPDRATRIARATDTLRTQLNPSTVWQSAYLPPEFRGRIAYGDELTEWAAPRDDITPGEAELLEAAWSAALPPLDLGMDRYLRLRVDTVDDVRRLRAIGDIDGLTIAPSLRSRGWKRSLQWRWPFHVGVVDGPLADEWLASVRDSRHHGRVFDAELFDPAAFDPATTYDIAIVNASDLSGLPAAEARRLGEASCVIVVGDEPVDLLLAELETLAEPCIAVALNRPPAAWWKGLFEEMSHDVPIDAAVEHIARAGDVDALVAGPRHGMDITAAAHWFVAVAPEVPELAGALAEFPVWYWTYESDGATDETDAVRDVRARGGDPVAIVPSPATAGVSRDIPDFDIDDVVVEKPPEPRRLIARVFDGETVVTSILPPKHPLKLAIRIAIPERDDAVADAAFPALPGAGPTVNLDVIVRGDVWEQQPPKQTISISRQKSTEPSTWAVFPLTTPGEGAVVNIDVRVLYQGKPIQAAMYTSPVRVAAVPGEKPTLTTFTLSGPDEPTDELRPVDLTLDGSGAELKRFDSDAKVLITDVQDKLNKIEDRVSRVLGVPGAPDTFADGRAVDLLVTLAGIGIELKTILEPLDIGDARSINVVVNPETRVLPLELVYDGPPPSTGAKLCNHGSKPPPDPGRACKKASTKQVCPYAFWGLYRSIARTIEWKADNESPQPWTATIPTSSVLYAATVIADEGASEPLPSASVLATAQTLFQRVNRVKTWKEWLKAVKADKPNLLVVLGHTEGTGTSLYIGSKRTSPLARFRISNSYLGAKGSPRPLVLLIACATAALGDPFGSLPGTLTAKGAGAVIGTLSKIVGPHGAAAATHLLRAVHDLAGQDATVGDAVTAARRSLIEEQRPVGLFLVSHGEMDTKVVV